MMLAYLASLLRRLSRRRLVVEHVHYIKTPSPDRLSKPLEMARKAGRDDLVKRLEELL